MRSIIKQGFKDRQVKALIFFNSSPKDRVRKVFKDAQNTYGTEVIELLSKIRADIFVLGVCGMHHQIGVTMPDWGESVVKRKMTDISAKTIALVTADKLNTAENYVVCSYQQIDVMLTDDTISESQLVDYQGVGVEVL